MHDWHIALMDISEKIKFSLLEVGFEKKDYFKWLLFLWLEEI